MEIEVKNLGFNASLGKEVVVNKTTSKPSIYSEVSREIEKIEVSYGNDSTSN